MIRITDGRIHSIDAAEVLPATEIGELIVRGPVVTSEYVTRREANALAKIHDSTANDASANTFWHRMGDCGYLDQHDRFWFCGRVAHRVLTAFGAMYTIPCEAIFNQHPRVFRTALVGVGTRGEHTPVIIVEPKRGQFPRSRSDCDALFSELSDLGRQHEHTKVINHYLLHRRMPVDIRHNAKIFREKLAAWAQRKLG